MHAATPSRRLWRTMECFVSIAPVDHGQRPAEDTSAGRTTFASGRAHANSTLPLLVMMYWRPSSSKLMGELCMGEPVPACHRVLPSLVSSASTLPELSPVIVSPESVVMTPAPEPPPSSWIQLILPV